VASHLESQAVAFSCAVIRKVSCVGGITRLGATLSIGKPCANTDVTTCLREKHYLDQCNMKMAQKNVTAELNIRFQPARALQV
jgi:hypothetical protein